MGNEKDDTSWKTFFAIYITGAKSICVICKRNSLEFIFKRVQWGEKKPGSSERDINN